MYDVNKFLFRKYRGNGKYRGYLEGLGANLRKAARSAPPIVKAAEDVGGKNTQY